MFFVSYSGFSANHENGNARGIAHGTKTLAEFESGELGHHQIEEDGLGFVFQASPKACSGLAVIDDFIAIRQTRPQKTTHGFVVVDDQDSLHVGSPDF